MAEDAKITWGESERLCGLSSRVEQTKVKGDERYYIRLCKTRPSVCFLEEDDGGRQFGGSRTERVKKSEKRAQKYIINK